MKTNRIEITIQEYQTNESIPANDLELMEQAVIASQSSYAPYSQFHVGAAILLENGEIIKGSNQENAAYPSGLCAERVALFSAKSVFPDIPIQAIAITAHSDDFETEVPVTPCGSCRQVLAEMQNRQTKKIKIIMKGQKGATFVTDGIENLLPLMFIEEKLKKSKK